MSFDDRSLRLDDSPRKRVLAKHPDLACTAVKSNDGTIIAYVIHRNGKGLYEARSAWDAWRSAEAELIVGPEIEAKRMEKLNGIKN